MKILDALFTGSLVYGEPTSVSDVDLAVLVDDEAREILHDKCDSVEGSGSPQSVSVRFGLMNVLVFTDRDDFDRWRTVNDALIEIQPVTREQAVTAFKARSHVKDAADVRALICGMALAGKREQAVPIELLVDL